MIIVEKMLRSMDGTKKENSSVKIVKMKNKEKILQGKRNKAAGQRFELKVRKDLEDKGWIVSKWMNNVELEIIPHVLKELEIKGKLIPAKHKFRGPGIPMAIGTGMPDFVCFKKLSGKEILEKMKNV